MVIRERVEVAPPEPAPLATAGVEAAPSVDLCALPVVAYVLYKARNGFQNNAPHSVGGPADGTYEVRADCGSASGDLAPGLELQSIFENHVRGDDGSYDRYNYAPVDSVELFRLPLRPTEGPAAATLTFRGVARDEVRSFAGFVDRFSCGEGCGANLGVRGTVVGWAERREHPWPDSVACGTTTPLPVLAVKGDGSEGYVGPGATAAYELLHTVGSLAVGDSVVAPKTRLGIGYPEARAGSVAYQAPACSDVRRDTPVTILTDGVGQGGAFVSIVVQAPPLVRYRLNPTRDTLGMGATSTAIRAVAVRADGREGYLDPETEVEFTARPDSGEFRQLDFEYAPTVTMSYDERGCARTARSDGAIYRLRQSVRDSLPQYHLPVVVTASGGGLTGADTLVVRGRDGAGPDSLAVTLADAEVPCGDSTRVTVRGVLDGEPRALPDTARVRLTVADSSRAVLSWGGVSGPSVEVPVGAVRDSAAVGVWVTTRGCAETAGFLRVDVLAEADAYWDVDGTVTGRGTAIVLGGANGGGGEDDEEDTASGSLGLPVVMLRQDDTQVSVLPDPYVMVSKVRPDWLLPTARVAFRSPFAGHRPFENDLAQPDTAVHFDPDTYRPELLGVPDSLVSQGDRIEFVLRVVPGLLGKGLDGGSELRARGAAKAPAAAHRAGSVVGPGSAGAYRARADQFVRFVSNGRPASGAASSCSPWPPPDAGMESDGGACRYDDEVAGDQTILVRLLDTVRVTALYNGTDGVTDTLGTATWRVGLPGTEDGIDAVRRVNLVWHDYVQADGTRLTSAPAEVARRVSEDFAQASISVSSIGAATTFRSDEIETVLEIEVSTPPDVPGQVELEVVKNDGSVVPVVVPYPAEATAETVAFLIAQELASSTVGASPDFPYPGSNDGEFWYVAVNSGLAQEVRIVNGGASNGVTILTQLEFLESVRLGSEAASAAGWAVADQDRSTIDALTVPRIAIQHGDPSDQTYAYALPGTEPRLFVTEEVADGDDREGAHVAAHEIGHLLLPEPFGPDGGPECADDQVDSHHPAPYNLMFCEALLNGEWEGGPKRLTPEQHRQTRLQNGNRSTVPLLKRP